MNDQDVADDSDDPVDQARKFGSTVLGIPIGLLEDDCWETASIIPATGCVAKFTDGESYPVLCWALQVQIDRQYSLGLITRVVGLIFESKGGSLVEVDGIDGFDEYLYE